MSFIVTIDGEAASGKGTLAKMLVTHFNFAYLETGLLYRLVAKIAYDRDVLDHQVAILDIAQSIQYSDLSAHSLKSDHIAITAAKIAVIKELRDVMVQFQRDFALNPPCVKGKVATGIVMDGRDIGTVIFPNADVKFYVSASLEERAKRRYDELKSLKPLSNINYDGILLSLKQRDTQDKSRTQAPLKCAKDAIIIDTTHTTPKQAFAVMVPYIKRKLL